METRRNQQTGTRITVGRAARLALDEAGGRWVTVCEEHGMIVNHPTRREANRHATDPLGWCEGCQQAMRAKLGMGG